MSLLTVEAAAALLLLDRQAFRFSSITIVDYIHGVWIVEGLWIVDFVELMSRDKVLYEGSGEASGA